MAADLRAAAEDLPSLVMDEDDGIDIAVALERLADRWTRAIWLAELADSARPDGAP